MIGSLRHHITLQERSDAPDSGGGTATAWVDVAQLWASVEILSGTEQVQAMSVRATRRYRVRTRYRADINAANRFLHDGRVLNIRSVRDVGERRQWLEFSCEEGVAD